MLKIKKGYKLSNFELDIKKIGIMREKIDLIICTFLN